MMRFIFDLMTQMRELAQDSLESDVQFNFAGLVTVIATKLSVALAPKSESKVIVGGILVHYQYDLRGSTDPRFVHPRTKLGIIASEVKTDKTFGEGAIWYHQSRGVQVLSTLYAHNCPTFLLTQSSWKLFVENTDWNAVLTFPFSMVAGVHELEASCQLMGVGETFMKAIVICLLSEKPNPTSLKRPVPGATSTSSVATDKTPLRSLKRRPTPYSSDGNPHAPAPKYISGQIRGRQRYSIIRIYSEETVSKWEDEIAQEEKEQKLKST